MIDWGTVAPVVVAVIFTAILWWIAHRARRHPIEEGL